MLWTGKLCAAKATTTASLATSTPMFGKVCMTGTSRSKLTVLGWHTPTLACVQIGGQCTLPLDSSSTFGGGGGVSPGSLSQMGQMQADVPPPQFLPVSQEGTRNPIQACRSTRTRSHFDIAFS